MLTLQDLSDRAELTDLVSRLGRWLDEPTSATPDELFTDDVTARTPGGRSAGRDAVVAQARRNHAHATTQHVIADVLADVDGDGARVGANLVVTFDGEDGRRTLGERYAFTARRTAAGWRLAEIGVEPVWAEDVAR